MKIYLIVIVILLSYSNLYAQKQFYTWDEIKSRDMPTYVMNESEKKKFSEILNRHVKNFKKGWKHIQRGVGKDYRKRLLKNLDCYYVLQCSIVDTVGKTTIKLSDNIIKYIYFVSGNTELGVFDAYYVNHMNRLYYNKGLVKTLIADNLYSSRNYHPNFKNYNVINIELMNDFYGKDHQILYIDNLKKDNFYDVGIIATKGLKPIKFNYHELNSEFSPYNRESQFKNY